MGGFTFVEPSARRLLGDVLARTMNTGSAPSVKDLVEGDPSSRRLILSLRTRGLLHQVPGDEEAYPCVLTLEGLRGSGHEDAKKEHATVVRVYEALRTLTRSVEPWDLSKLARQVEESEDACRRSLGYLVAGHDSIGGWTQGSTGLPRKVDPTFALSMAPPAWVSRRTFEVEPPRSAALLQEYYDVGCRKFHDVGIDGGRGLSLSGASFSGGLIGGDLEAADLSGCRFEGVNMRGARLTDARLHDAVFVDVDLVGADLSRADLRRADLRRAVLDGAQAQGALADGVLWTRQQVDLLAPCRVRFGGGVVDPADTLTEEVPLMYQDGQGWIVEFGGHRYVVPGETSGLRFLARLLAAPGERVHVLELELGRDFRDVDETVAVLDSLELGPVDLESMTDQHRLRWHAYVGAMHVLGSQRGREKKERSRKLRDHLEADVLPRGGELTRDGPIDEACTRVRKALQKAIARLPAEVQDRVRPHMAEWCVYPWPPGP